MFFLTKKSKMISKLQNLEFDNETIYTMNNNFVNYKHKDLFNNMFIYDSLVTTTNPKYGPEFGLFIPIMKSTFIKQIIKNSKYENLNNENKPGIILVQNYLNCSICLPKFIMEKKCMVNDIELNTINMHFLFDTDKVCIIFSKLNTKYSFLEKKIFNILVNNKLLYEVEGL